MATAAASISVAKPRAVRLREVDLPIDGRSRLNIGPLVDERAKDEKSAPATSCVLVIPTSIGHLCGAVLEPGQLKGRSVAVLVRNFAE